MTSVVTTTANEVLNRVSAEVGLLVSQDPWAENGGHWVQMKPLLQIAGEELAKLYPWEILVKEHQITTSSSDSGDYPLPDDFLYMINQTGWERNENVPLFGPLSAQDWQYLLGRDLVSSTIYASFRIQQGIFAIFPQPPPDNLDIRYEYINRNWVLNSASANEENDTILQGGDILLYDRTLISRMLKVKWLEAKRFDTTKAQDDFNQIYQQLTAHDKGAEILQAGRTRNRNFPYLNALRNTPDSGYGP